MSTPFNLYYAGYRGRETEGHLYDMGLLRLMSYANEPKYIDEWIAKGGGARLFADSGAFSVYKRGITIEIDTFIDWVNERIENLQWVAQLDVIGDGVKSWQNYLYMCNKVKQPEKVIAVYHRGQPIQLLHDLLAYQPRIDIMALGGMAWATPQERVKWIDMMFRYIKASPNPNIKVHAFGMTSLKLLEQFSWYSADSSTWLQTAINGGILTKWGTILVSKQTQKRDDNAKYLSQFHRDELKAYVASYGFELENLVEHDKERCRFNMCYLKEWSENYKYKPLIKQKKLF